MSITCIMFNTNPLLPELCKVLFFICVLNTVIYVGIFQNTLHECGKAGDIGAIGKNLGIGKIIHGNNANVGAWPWQVVVTIRRSTVSKVSALIGMFSCSSKPGNFIDFCLIF